MQNPLGSAGKLIKLSKSSISQAEKSAVMGVLDRGMFGMGAEVQKFEDALSQYFGRNVVCVVNGTAALQLALEAAGIGVGDEVLVPSLTYVASFQAISAAGATPVPCDVFEDTLTLNTADLASRLTEKTKAVMPVHYAGNPGDLDAIYLFAEKYKLRVIEDAAHAFGSSYKSKRIGSYGDTACFSFDGIKNITSGEGGCIVSADEVLLEKIRDLRLLGVKNDTQNRYSGRRTWEFDVTEQGWRYHMSNIMAAIGIEQLKRSENLAHKRQELAKRYHSNLSCQKGVRLLQASYAHQVPHIFPIILGENLDRETIREFLYGHEIETGIHYKPNHLLTKFQLKSHDLPVTNRIYKRLLTLPLHPDLNFDEIDYISKSLILAIETNG